MDRTTQQESPSLSGWGGCQILKDTKSMNLYTLNSRPSLLMVDDDPVICDTLQFILAKSFNVSVVHTRSAAISALRQLNGTPALALVDLGLPPSPHTPDEGFALIGDLLAHAPNIRIVVLSGQNEELHARHARTLGAIDFVPKPCDPKKIVKILQQAVMVQSIDERPAERFCLETRLLGRSEPMQRLRTQIGLFAQSPFSVLIEGESGSGKELVAAALHQAGPYHAAPMLSLNCAAISPSLVESTLFGYAKGAFTGANNARTGYFEDVGTGILFLDEVGEMPLEMQAKLLRVLENGEYYRVGETQVRTTKARVLAATNRDLRAEVQAGRFRADLYHRLSILSLQMPPLRHMGMDKLLLLQHFMHSYAEKLNLPVFRLDSAAEQRWLAYPFSGNVRELRNIVIRLLTKYSGQIVGEAQLEQDLDTDIYAAQSTECVGEPTEAAALTYLKEHGSFNIDHWLRGWERCFMDAALKMTRGNMTQAAKSLGINRTTLYSRLENLEKFTAQTLDSLDG